MDLLQMMVGGVKFQMKEVEKENVKELEEDKTIQITFRMKWRTVMEEMDMEAVKEPQALLLNLQ